MEQVKNVLIAYFVSLNVNLADINSSLTACSTALVIVFTAYKFYKEFKEGSKNK